MRIFTLFLLTLSIFFFSCKRKEELNFNNLIGSWTTEYKFGADTIYGADDRLIFLTNDSVKATGYLHEKRVLNLQGTYSLNKDTREITMRMDTMVTVCAIEVLTDSRLVLNSKTPLTGRTRFVKLKE